MKGVAVSSPGVVADPQPARPGGAAVVGWLAHPVTLLGLLVLVVNDHIGKLAYPGTVTGKLSDVAGLVVAPPLLATTLVLLMPRLTGRTAALIAVVATGVGFTAVQLSTAASGAASQLWSVMAGPSRLYADATDLAALPALAVAWWAWRRSTRRSVPHRLVRLAQGIVVLPVAILAVAATSTSYPYAAAVAEWNGGLVAGQTNAASDNDDQRPNWDFSGDAGRTWRSLDDTEHQRRQAELPVEQTARQQDCESNDRLHWVEQVYHQAVHSETGQPPLQRWAAGGPFPLPVPAQLAEAFLWEEHRQVTKTATVSLHGNTYQVDPALVGRRVELVFDPFDLTTIEVRLGSGAPKGLAIPHRIGRHAHPKARPETPTAPALTPSGIDYLHLIDTAYQQHLTEQINYAALVDEDKHPDTSRPPTKDLHARLQFAEPGDVPDHAVDEEPGPSPSRQPFPHGGLRAAPTQRGFAVDDKHRAAGLRQHCASAVSANLIEAYGASALLNGHRDDPESGLPSLATEAGRAVGSAERPGRQHPVVARRVEATAPTAAVAPGRIRPGATAVEVSVGGGSGSRWPGRLRRCPG